MTNSSAASQDTPQVQAQKKKGFLREWGPLGLFVIIVLLSRVFIWGTVVVDGPSMDPTLADGQRLLIAKVGGFSRGDVVVANESAEQSEKNSTGGATKSKTIVKRVIGLPGDTLVFKNDTLTINGKEYTQPWLKKYKTLFDDQKLGDTYKKGLILSGVKGSELEAQRSIFANMADSAPAFTTVTDPVDGTGRKQLAEFTVKVPQGQYYLMGDNRTVSADSRTVGAFDKKQITGKVLFRFWPLSKIGTV